MDHTKSNYAPLCKREIMISNHVWNLVCAAGLLLLSSCGGGVDTELDASGAGSGSLGSSGISSSGFGTSGASGGGFGSSGTPTTGSNSVLTLGALSGTGQCDSFVVDASSSVSTTITYEDPTAYICIGLTATSTSATLTVTPKASSNQGGTYRWPFEIVGLQPGSLTLSFVKEKQDPNDPPCSGYSESGTQVATCTTSVF